MQAENHKTNIKIVNSVDVIFTPIPYPAKTAIFVNGDVIFISGDDKTGTAYIATKKD